MNKINVTITTLFLLCFQIIIVAQVPAHEDVNKEITAVLRSPYDNKIELMLSHVHPKIITVSGGRVEFKKVMIKIFAQIKEVGLKFVSAEVGKPYSYMRSEAREFFLVDVNLVLSKDGKETRNKITQIAIKDKGSKVWTYTDGSGVTDKTLRTLFPDTPKKFTLSKTVETEKKK